eukprot:IDg10622t1
MPDRIKPIMGSFDIVRADFPALLGMDVLDCERLLAVAVYNRLARRKAFKLAATRGSTLTTAATSCTTSFSSFFRKDAKSDSLRSTRARYDRDDEYTKGHISIIITGTALGRYTKSVGVVGCCRKMLSEQRVVEVDKVASIEADKSGDLSPNLGDDSGVLADKEKNCGDDGQ